MATVALPPKSFTPPTLQVEGNDVLRQVMEDILQKGTITEEDQRRIKRAIPQFRTPGSIKIDDNPQAEAAIKKLLASPEKNQEKVSAELEQILKLLGKHWSPAEAAGYVALMGALDAAGRISPSEDQHFQRVSQLENDAFEDYAARMRGNARLKSAGINLGTTAAGAGLFFGLAGGTMSGGLLLLPFVLALSVGGILASRKLSQDAEVKISHWGINQFEHETKD